EAERRDHAVAPRACMIVRLGDRDAEAGESCGSPAGAVHAPISVVLVARPEEHQRLVNVRYGEPGGRIRIPDCPLEDVELSLFVDGLDLREIGAQGETRVDRLFPPVSIPEPAGEMVIVVRVDHMRSAPWPFSLGDEVSHPRDLSLDRLHPGDGLL